MINNFRLDELAVEAAKRAYFDGEIEAIFMNFPTLKCRYEKHHKYLRLEMSHFMQEAPEEVVIEAIVRTIKDSNGLTNGRPSDAYIKWCAENRHKWTVKE